MFGMTTAHRLFAVLLGLAVPLGSWVFASGELSYRMYAHAAEYRLDVFGVNAAGQRRRMAPSGLARAARPSVIPLLAGADHWRTQPRIDDLGSALAELARHGCGVERALKSIEIVLEERAREGSTVRTTRAAATCAP